MAGTHMLGHGHIGHRIKLYSKGMQIWDSFTGVGLLFDTQAAVKTTGPCSFTYSVFNNKIEYLKCYCFYLIIKAIGMFSFIQVASPTK